MHQEFTAKLKLTAAVLGCTSRKEFCSRFRAVNPTTPCELERLHKWLQGKAAPRPGQFYDDWAKVLGSNRKGAWFESCSLDAFLDEICGIFGVTPSELLVADPLADRGAASSGPSHSGAARYLLGSYACYSYSWSPYYRDKLIRGGISLAPGRGAAFAATYSEGLLGGIMRFQGEALVAGPALHVKTADPSAGMQLHMHLFVPGPPASALYGLMSGTTVLRDEPSITAGRILLIRVPDDADLDGSNAYLDPLPGMIVRDLMALGVAVVDPDEVDALACELLNAIRPGGAGSIEQVKASDAARLTAALHKASIERSERRPKAPATIAALRRARLREV